MNNLDRFDNRPRSFAEYCKTAGTVPYAQSEDYLQSPEGQRRSRLIVPDLDKYITIRVEPDNSCDGCVFFSDINVRCSAIPCIPRMGRRYRVIYQEKPAEPDPSDS